MAEHGPSEKAVEAAANAVQEEFDERGLGPANLLASVMLDEAHDRGLGLDRSVSLRACRDWLSKSGPDWLTEQFERAVTESSSPDREGAEHG